MDAERPQENPQQARGDFGLLVVSGVGLAVCRRRRLIAGLLVPLLIGGLAVSGVLVPRLLVAGLLRLLIPRRVGAILVPLAPLVGVKPAVGVGDLGRGAG
ncbi:hypothetical protein [Actinomyces ruminis]|uniref:hypothetical protein n=1 Tax=Actinomyces ruminis TaxID=1937003 RepID=UPI001177BF92|nr:hypothetical protein [Actinomyces ruminis]